MLAIGSPIAALISAFLTPISGDKWTARGRWIWVLKYIGLIIAYVVVSVGFGLACCAVTVDAWLSFLVKPA